MKLNISRMETLESCCCSLFYVHVFVFGRFTLLEFDRIRAKDSNLSHSASIK